MKILQMNLTAFGPFTDTRIPMAGGEEGLHIIYGPNEAGKSSALRALRQMLYGIPERSRDNFTHPHNMLRIGAALRHSDGKVFEFIRRKGRVNTVRAVDDKTVLDEGELERFLGGVGGDVFATMFGIDHADLIRGGREIVQGGGSLGQVLFAAGAGISNLRRVQFELQEEADGLFRPSGQKQRINETVSALNRCRKELRDAQLPDREWERHDRALRDALRSKAVIECALEEKQKERRRLERINEALPLIARREEVLADRAALVDAVLVPEEFGDRRRELITELKIAENDRARANRAIEEIDREKDSLEVPQMLLENADMIEQLYRDLGGQQKAARDRNGLLTRRDILWGEAKEILSGLRRDLALEEADKLRLKRTDIVRIQELGSRYERLVTRLEGAREGAARISPRLQALEKETGRLASPRDMDELKIALEKALKQGALEDLHESDLQEIRNAQGSVETSLKRQTLWTGTLDDLEVQALPSLETIDAFDERLGEALRTRAGLEEDIAEEEGIAQEIEGRIEHLRLEREVPTEKDLEAVRGKREKGWELVRRTWERGEKPDKNGAAFLALFPPAATLADAYELSVQRADEVSDRLRREADRVAKMASLLAERETRKARLEALRSRLGQALGDVENLTHAWADLWKGLGISPLTPREMRAWTQDQKALAEQVSTLRERKARAEDLKGRIEACHRELKESLSALGEAPAQDGESLSHLIARAGNLIQREEALRGKREQLEGETIQRRKELEEIRSQAAQLEEELSRWRGQWDQAVRPLGLDGHAVPAEANIVVEDLKNLFDKLKEAEILHKRIKGIDRDREDFQRMVTGLVEGLSPDLKALPAEQAAAELQAGLNRARTARSHREALDKQRTQEEKKRIEASGKISEIESELAIMCQEAGCNRYEELPLAERRSEQRRRVESDLGDVEERLRNLSGGATIEGFVTEARGVDPDSIEGRVARLAEEIDALNRERSDLDQAIGTERNELGKMDGSARAADLAEEVQMLLGGLETHVEHYIRIRLATTVLAQAIERYREKHQGPVLRRANQLFADLTRGSFEGVRAEYNEQGEPVLMGVRRGGREIVGVEGMSDGTTDQLYLALRLAGLENYLEKNESMPFIVDDILIRFDDERAGAAIQVLAELSRKTQVIFFTHHRHLLELARDSVDPSVLFEHVLPA